MKRTALLAFLAVLASGTAFGEAAHHAAPAPATANAAASPLADGEIRKVDKDAGKVTIKHGPLVSLDMPAMTMVFRVKDPSMLDKVKVGDQIRFKAEQLDGALTVTEYQPTK